MDNSDFLKWVLGIVAVLSTIAIVSLWKFVANKADKCALDLSNKDREEAVAKLALELKAVDLKFSSVMNAADGRERIEVVALQSRQNLAEVKLLLAEQRADIRAIAATLDALPTRVQSLEKSRDSH